MKLSEAIRLGAMQLPPTTDCRLFWYGESFADPPCAACAIGAAAFAVGFKNGFEFCGGLSTGAWGPLADKLPLVMMRNVSVPVGRWPDDWNLGQIISGLFECHKWSREQIADWVEGIEQAQEAGSRRAVAESGAETETVTTSVRLVPQKFLEFSLGGVPWTRERSNSLSVWMWVPSGHGGRRLIVPS